MARAYTVIENPNVRGNALRDELKPMQEDARKELEKLATIRNKFAHRLSYIGMDEKRRKAVVGLIDKEHKVRWISEKTLDDFAHKCARVVVMLEKIMYVQKGINPPVKEKTVWLTRDALSKIDF